MWASLSPGKRLVEDEDPSDTLEGETGSRQPPVSKWRHYLGGDPLYEPFGKHEALLEREKLPPGTFDSEKVEKRRTMPVRIRLTDHRFLRHPRRPESQARPGLINLLPNYSLVSDMTVSPSGF